jgi:methylenetetrahydrofolate dehydrogenase (NADP+)/methenyltetrahydrofolate cyclohydrolase
MSAHIIDGNAIAALIKAEVAGRVAVLKRRGVVPGLAALLVGDNPASLSYVSGKARDCEEVGIYAETLRFPESIAEPELLAEVERLNGDPRFHGILPQLPLPPQVDESRIIASLRAAKDVDGLHPINLGRLLGGDTRGPLPCTPHGVLQMLGRSGIETAGRHAVVVGRSTLVGRPLAVLLSNKAAGANATVTICHTATVGLARHTREADIVILAAGRPNTLTASMVKPGVVVIDVGTNRIDDASRKRGWRLVGDADFPALKEKASWITPVPGGVGPMTRAMLLVNTVTAAEQAAS